MLCYCELWDGCVLECVLRWMGSLCLMSWGLISELWVVRLCCGVLCSVVLCCVVLYCVVLYYVVLCYIILYSIICCVRLGFYRFLCLIYI